MVDQTRSNFQEKRLSFSSLEHSTNFIVKLQSSFLILARARTHRYSCSRPLSSLLSYPPFRLYPDSEHGRDMFSSYVKCRYPSEVDNHVVFSSPPISEYLLCWPEIISVSRFVFSLSRAILERQIVKKFVSFDVSNLTS